MLVRVIAFGGNLLLNIGPEGDGRIPLIFQERLRKIGEFLDIHEEAIFDSVYYPLGQSEANKTIFYTMSADEQFVYVFFWTWPRFSFFFLSFLSLSPFLS